jgi:hypothetical protein
MRAAVYGAHRVAERGDRCRLGRTGPDPVDAAVDAKLGVVRDGGFLRLEPASVKAAP